MKSLLPIKINYAWVWGRRKRLEGLLTLQTDVKCDKVSIDSVIEALSSIQKFRSRFPSYFLPTPPFWRLLRKGEIGEKAWRVFIKWPLSSDTKGISLSEFGVKENFLYVRFHRFAGEEANVRVSSGLMLDLGSLHPCPGLSLLREKVGFWQRKEYGFPPDKSTLFPTTTISPHRPLLPKMLTWYVSLNVIFSTLFQVLIYYPSLFHCQRRPGPFFPLFHAYLLPLPLSLIISN